MTVRARRLRAGIAAALVLLPCVALGADGAADAPVRFTDGAALFQANCAVCHRANGAGQAGLAPPLLVYPARYARSVEGRRQLAMTLLYGMFGEITVDERHYNFKMPDFARFDDATLAALINYVVFDLGHAPPEVAALAPEAIAAERATAQTGEAVRRHRAEVLEAPAP